MRLFDGIEKYFEAENTDTSKQTRYKTDNYDYYYKRLIVNYFENVDLDEFEVGVINGGIRKMRRDYYEAETLKRVVRIFRYTFVYLYREGMIPVDYVASHIKEITAIAKGDSLTAEERQRILKSIRHLQYGNLFGFVIKSGVKPDRATALTRNAVYLMDDECYADHVLRGVDRDGNPILEPVTSGITRYTLSEDAKRFLIKEERQQALYKQRAGDRWSNVLDLVFTDAYGRPITRVMLREDCELLIRLTGIPGLTLDRLAKMYLDFLMDEVNPV